MAHRNLLNDEEIAFLHSLLSEPDPPGQRDASFNVQGSAKGIAFLKHLAEHNDLTLEATSGNVHMRFALRFQQDELGHAYLHLQTPRLTDVDPNPRAWRAKLPIPLDLLDGQHNPLNWQMHELSASGAVIAFGVPAPKYCEFLLPLPGAMLSIRAKRVRYIDLTSAAYRIFTATPRDLDRLRTFVYFQHQRQQKLP